MMSNDRSGLPGSRSLVDEMTECAEDDDLSDSSIETTSLNTSSQRQPLHRSFNPPENTGFSPYRQPQNHHISTQKSNTNIIQHNQSPQSNQRQFIPSLEKAKLPFIPPSSIPLADLNTERYKIKSTNHSTTSVSMPSMTAATFARDAPKAGFLYKDGKRRFFVLKPTTCLYYFANATDREPRGCIDLDSGSGVTLRETPSSNTNGRLGFEILLPILSQDKNLPVGGGGQTTTIRLEAEEETTGREWMHLITVERLSHSKSVVESLSARVAALENEKKDLYRQLDNFHLVEQDRDGAIQDAQGWKTKFEQLNHGLDILRVNIIEDSSTEDWMDRKRVKTEWVTDDTLLSKFITDHDLQSTHLSPLSHCYKNLKSKMQCEYERFSATKQELDDSLGKITELEEKLRQLEENTSKLFEENLDLRENLKKIKMERKILVKEVRSLRKTSTDYQDETERLRKECEQLTSTLSSLKLESAPRNANESNNFMARRKQLATPEKRLFFELEDSMTSTLILNQQFLASHIPSNNFVQHSENVLDTHQTATQNATLEKSPSDDEEEKDISVSSPVEGDEVEKDISISSQSVSPLRPKILASPESLSRVNQSLLDSVTYDTPNEHGNDSPSRYIERARSSEDKFNTHHNKSMITTIDDDHGASTASTIPCDSSAQSSAFSVRSLVTTNGEATSKLVCPFIDVAETRPKYDPQNEQISDRDQVYHLTFYGSKIGIQFQKVPSESFNNGKLADAMRADLFDEGRMRTNMELQKVRSIAKFNSNSGFDVSLGDETSCPIVYPKDIVLVCGFQGFDELSNSNKRPQLGARLIAFDGISVEIGPWTFDSIRKSIQARGRPITLSFRNEYLSTKQRSILTKAVNDLNSSFPPPDQFYHYNIPELTSTFHSQATNQQRFDGVTEYAPAYQITNRTDYPSDAESSITESAASPMNPRKNIPFSKRKAASKTWKSFSDVGSSTSSSKFASKFGPMMSNLVSTFNTSKESVTQPEYMSRVPNYVESRKQHQHYRANLL